MKRSLYVQVEYSSLLSVSSAYSDDVKLPSESYAPKLSVQFLGKFKLYVLDVCDAILQ